MKKSLFLFAALAVVVLVFAGISTTDVQALMVPTPADECNFTLAYIASVDTLLPGSRYDPAKEQCLMGWEGDLWGGSWCGGGLEVWQVVWSSYPVGDSMVGADFYSPYYFDFVGCTGVADYIKDPNQGGGSLGDGVSFEYEAQTCTNGCSITRFGLTGAAKKALGKLNGEVWGKTYIQIRDDDGNLVSGDFKLCFYAKGTTNPYFFRFSGGNSWAPMGGYWQGNNFCMNGTISGNYVLVDMP